MAQQTSSRPPVCPVCRHEAPDGLDLDALSTSARATVEHRERHSARADATAEIDQIRRDRRGAGRGPVADARRQRAERKA